MQKWRQWEAASESDWGLAVEREGVIRPLAERQKLKIDDVEDAMHRLRISRSVLYSLLHRYKQRPQTSSLLPWKRGRDKNVSVLHQDREQLLDHCIKDFYWGPSRIGTKFYAKLYLVFIQLVTSDCFQETPDCHKFFC